MELEFDPKFIEKEKPNSAVTTVAANWRNF